MKENLPTIPENWNLIHELHIDKGQEPMRVDKFVTARYEKMTRNKVQKAIEEQRVRVNGQIVKSNFKIRALDFLEIYLDGEPRPKGIVPQDIPLNIVYEDEDLMVINKPPGLVVHPGVGNHDGTLVNALAHYLDRADAINQRPFLAHRIDKDTSGLLVIAKNEPTLNSLVAQFKNHSTERTYNALVWGVPAEKEGTINTYIGRHPRERKLFYAYPEGEIGKPAITHYKVLEDFTFTSLVECKLETGRTHQIRVHMKHLGHVLFNDSFYKGDRILKGVVFSKYKQFIDNCFKLMPRQALHAKTLGFEHPTQKKWMQFNSDWPADFSAVVEKWRSLNNTYDFNS